MARPVVLTKQLAASANNNIAQAQVPVSGTALTLNGVLASGGVATLDTPRRVLLTFGNEAQNRTLVVNGTMEGGAAISETLAVASGAGGTIATTQDFATVTSAVPAGGGWSAAASLGTNGVGSTRWVLLNAHIDPFEIGAQLKLLSGAANFSLEITDDEVMMPIPIYQTGYSQAMPVPTAYGWPGMAAVAGPAQGVINHPCRAARLTINSGTGQASLTLTQAGIRN